MTDYDNYIDNVNALIEVFGLEDEPHIKIPLIVDGERVEIIAFTGEENED